VIVANKGKVPASTNVFNVAVLLMVVFNSGGVTIFNHYYITLAIFCLLMLRMSLKRIIPNVKSIIAFIFFFFLLVLNFVVNPSLSSVVDYLIYLSYILTAVWVLDGYRNVRFSFVEDLFVALKIIMFHALIGFVFQFVGRSFLFPLSDRIDTFYYIFYYPSREMYPFLLRNQGVFWEPGVLQIYMNILFYIACFIKKDIRISVLSALAVASSFSTTGYVILFMLVVVAFASRIRTSYIAIALMLVVFPLLMALVSINVYQKLTGDFSKSALVRMFDLSVGLTLVADHPLAGVGLGRDRYKDIFYGYGIGRIEKFSIAESELRDKGITNSVLFYASAFGVPIFLLFMVFLYKQALLQGANFLVFMVLFVSGLSEPIFNTVFFSLFFISGFWGVFTFQRRVIWLGRQNLIV